MFPFFTVSLSTYFLLIYTRMQVSYVSVSFSISAYFTSVNWISRITVTNKTDNYKLINNVVLFDVCPPGKSSGYCPAYTALIMANDSTKARPPSHTQFTAF